VSARAAAALLALHPVVAVAWAAAVTTRITAAHPERVWLLAALPIAAMAIAPRTRGRVVLAVLELALLVPLHAWITLLRAARLEGG
jgi:hypothetical protein